MRRSVCRIVIPVVLAPLRLPRVPLQELIVSCGNGIRLADHQVVAHIQMLSGQTALTLQGSQKSDLDSGAAYSLIVPLCSACYKQKNNATTSRLDKCANGIR